MAVEASMWTIYWWMRGVESMFVSKLQTSAPRDVCPCFCNEGFVVGIYWQISPYFTAEAWSQKPEPTPLLGSRHVPCDSRGMTWSQHGESNHGRDMELFITWPWSYLVIVCHCGMLPIFIDLFSFYFCQTWPVNHPKDAGFSSARFEYHWVSPNFSPSPNPGDRRHGLQAFQNGNLSYWTCKNKVCLGKNSLRCSPTRTCTTNLMEQKSCWESRKQAWALRRHMP